MPHFFLAPGSLQGDAVTLTGSLASHVAGALRHRTGDHITVVGEGGRRYRIVLTESSPRRVRGVIVDRLPSDHPPRFRVTLAQALLKGSHMDGVLQKATELGVHQIVPLVTRRTVVRPRDHRSSRQVERWRAIVLEAAQQSERVTIPTVHDLRPLDEWVRSRTSADATHLVLWERETSRYLRDYLGRGAPKDQAALMVGPEGGFDPEEVDLARAAGFVPVSLGRAILRAETAGLAALTILQYAWADLGGPRTPPDNAPHD
jgi:16S rRNA (uracil1498-N3)-methyltransferase